MIQTKYAAIFYSESSPGLGNHDAAERVRPHGLEQDAREICRAAAGFGGTVAPLLQTGSKNLHSIAVYLRQERGWVGRCGGIRRHCL